MTGLRHLLRDRRGFAAWLLALALLLKLFVPAGFMPVASGGSMRLEICTGMGVAPRAMAAMPGMAHHGDPSHPAERSEGPCGFGGLVAPALAATPALAAAIAFVVATWRPLPPARLATTPPPGLRPPPRGPPARP